MEELRFYIMADVGEFEYDLKMQESGLTLEEAKKLHSEKYSNGHKYGDVFICVEPDLN